MFVIKLRPNQCSCEECICLGGGCKQFEKFIFSSKIKIKYVWENINTNAKILTLTFKYA